MASKTRNPQRSGFMLPLAAFVVVVAGMKAATEILVPFLLASFIAIVAAPPMFWLRRKKVPDWLSLVIVILAALLCILAVSGLIGTSIRGFTEDLPGYEQRLKEVYGAILAWLEGWGVDLSDTMLTEILDPGAAMRLVAAGLNNLGKVLTNGFLILMTVIFMLIEASSLPGKLHRIFNGRQETLNNFDHFVDNINRYLALKTIISLVTGILATVLLALLGVDYAILWGLLAFILNYVPNIGSIIAAIPPVLLASVQLGLFKAAILAAGYVVLNITMGNVIEPRFMGKGLGLSTLVVFLSLLFWGWVLGPVGMLLSVPLTITAKIALDSREDTRWLSILLGSAK